jgi:Uma2 family endonuclease
MGEGAAKKKPTLVVEYLSPDEYAGKMMKRANRFLSAGVQLVWMIDPDDRSVLVYRLGSRHTWSRRARS